VWRGFLIACAALLLALSGRTAQLILVGKHSLGIDRAIHLGAITPHSDSVFINNQLTARETDYQLDTVQGVLRFVEGRIGLSDTVRIHWQPRFSQFGMFVGKELPTDAATSAPVPVRDALSQSALPLRRVETGSLAIRGAKSFRMSGGNAGVESTFGQTLDVSIAGKLSRSVELEGSISDRPDVGGYGTLNSRINEIDRLRLTLTSPVLRVEVGDMVQARTSNYHAANRRLSGIITTFHKDGWQATGTAARSKGEFQSSRVTPRDGIQGPYRIAGRTATQAIIPHSEAVWLDGRRLEPGVDKDYTIDYPAGSITFSSRMPIDTRSRIEIDFEGVQATYRRNVLGGSIGWGRNDSSLYTSIEVTDDRDDVDDFLIGEIDEATRMRLELAGDSAGRVRRTTITTDSLGSYIVLMDSLPDTVLQYVGSGSGNLSAQFSYFGSQGGRYIYAGNGEYRYVGAGLGEYEPVVLVTPARNLSSVSALIGGKWQVPGAIRVRAMQSHADNNLYSSVDDFDNIGRYVEMAQSRVWGEGVNRGAVAFRGNYREKQFRSNSRDIEADAAYLAMLPPSFDTLTDQFHGSGKARVPMGRGFSVTSEIGTTTAKGYFESYRAKAGAEWQVSRRVSIGYLLEELGTTGSEAHAIADADGRLHTASLWWMPVDSLRFALEGFGEQRIIRPSDTSHGSELWRWRLSLAGYSGNLYGEHAIIDTLNQSWSPARTRWRMGGDVRRAVGKLEYTTALSYQRIADSTGVQEAVGMQTALNYRDTRRKFNAGYEANISDEQRQERGLTWLDVGDGLGGYRFENGEYIADPFGKFLQIEEVLSGQTRVRRIERSSRLSREWAQFAFSANSRITEERITDEVWSVGWLAPFLIDPSEARQFLDWTYDAAIRAFPAKSIYRFSLKGVENRQSRRIGGAPRERRDRRLSMTLKQPFGEYLAEEDGELFDIDKDSWYSGGNAHGYSVSSTLRRYLSGSEMAVAVRYRHATGDLDAQSSLVSVVPSVHLRRKSAGNLRIEIELYSQTLTGQAAYYSLTDGHLGRRGVHWNLEARAGVTQTLRFNARLSGRHADNATARIQARSELVAEF
jgi:hypothetical protein